MYRKFFLLHFQGISGIDMKYSQCVIQGEYHYFGINIFEIGSVVLEITNKQLLPFYNKGIDYFNYQKASLNIIN